MKKSMKKFFAFIIIIIMVVTIAFFNFLGNFSVQAATNNLAYQLRGRIVLQVESHGEAWYINPDNLQRYYLGRPEDAFRIMRELGLGISNRDLYRLRIGQLVGQKLPANAGPLNGYFDYRLTQRLRGRIMLQVEAHGEAWYLNPVDSKRYYLGRPADAFNVMRFLGLGISDADLAKIPVNPKYDVFTNVENTKSKVEEVPWYEVPVEEKTLDDQFNLMMDEIADELNDMMAKVEETAKSVIIFTRESKGITYTGAALANFNFRLLVNKINLSEEELNGMKFVMAMMSSMIQKIQSETSVPLTDNIDLYFVLNEDEKLESLLLSFVDFNTTFTITENNISVFKNLITNLERQFDFDEADMEKALILSLEKIRLGKGFFLIDFKKIVDDIVGQDTQAAFEGIEFKVD